MPGWGLKPCPFCGGEGEPQDNHPDTRVVCADCGAQGPARIDREQAMLAWGYVDAHDCPNQEVIRKARMASGRQVEVLLYFPPSNSAAGRRQDTRVGFTQVCQRLVNDGLLECTVRVYPCTYRRTPDGDRVVELRTADCPNKERR